MQNNYSGEPFDFEEIDSIPVSTWTNAVFQKVTKPSTGEIFFMIQEQSSSSASRQYRKQGLMIPVESLRSFLPVLLKSISIFTSFSFVFLRSILWGIKSASFDNAAYAFT